MVHELWRQDDNGNQVRIATDAARNDAEAARAAFEARAHKQMYWVTSADAPATLHFVYGLPAAGKTGTTQEYRAAPRVPPPDTARPSSNSRSGDCCAQTGGPAIGLII